MTRKARKYNYAELGAILRGFRTQGRWEIKDIVEMIAETRTEAETLRLRTAISSAEIGRAVPQWILVKLANLYSQDVQEWLKLKERLRIEALKKTRLSKRRAKKRSGKTPDEGLLTLANAIKERRLLKGWSQERLAEKAGVGATTVHRLEKGISIGVRHLGKIARVLGFDPQYLVSMIGVQPSRPTSKTIKSAIKSEGIKSRGFTIIAGDKSQDCEGLDDLIERVKFLQGLGVTPTSVLVMMDRS